jgi:inactivation no afterpotential D protein
VIVDIIPKSIADNDKRLKVFDQILEINSVKITPELNGEQVQRAVRQVQAKVSKSVYISNEKLNIEFSFQVRMVVYRADPSEVETVEVDLIKKPGKMLGLGVQVGNPKGAVVSDVVILCLTMHFGGLF